MSETDRKTVNYTVACINEFAGRKGISPRSAFLYLYDYKGLCFLEEHYEIEHTLSFDDVLDDLEIVCRQNGGKLL